jgi:rSAM/selenodomain-associated transferase 1
LRGSTAAEAVVLVFARAPLPGRAKTRLVPALGAWGAARLQARLTARTLQAARAFPVQLHGTSRHAYFRSLGAPFFLQRGEDLGARMHHAVERALRRHRAAIVVGTDCPVLTARDLRRAAALLRSHDVVLAPAEDGGYALIGLRKPCATLFEGIEWGSASVLSETISRLGKTGLKWKALRTVWDVDRPEDLDRLRSRRFSSGSRRAARR